MKPVLEPLTCIVFFVIAMACGVIHPAIPPLADRCRVEFRSLELSGVGNKTAPMRYLTECWTRPLEWKSPLSL